jgi:hypothetical protein
MLVCFPDYTISADFLISLLRELYGTCPDLSSESHSQAQLHQEVLMSYRLLFGQKRDSRRLVKAALRALRNEVEDEYDGLLDFICAHECNGKLMRSLSVDLWPVSCRGVEGSLQEDSSYSSQDDFPLFGQRLVKLQEFTRRQQPSELWDLWRDKRNPLQWYTFWAVLIVGGISILLGFLQLLVAIAQLVVTSVVPPKTDCQC